MRIRGRPLTLDPSPLRGARVFGMGKSAFLWPPPALRFLETSLRDELGKFIWSHKPELESSIQRAVEGYANARDASLDGGPQPALVLGGSRVFDGQQNLPQPARQSLSETQRVRQVGKIIVITRNGLANSEPGGFQVLIKRAEQPGEAAMPDLAKNGGLGEVFEFASFHNNALVCIDRASFDEKLKCGNTEKLKWESRKQAAGRGLSVLNLDVAASRRARGAREKTGGDCGDDGKIMGAK